MAVPLFITGTATDDAPSKDSPCDTANPGCGPARDRGPIPRVRTVLPEAGWEPGGETGAVDRLVERREGLAGARAVGRQAAAEVAEDAHPVDVLDPLDEDDVGPVGHREVHREPGRRAT